MPKQEVTEEVQGFLKQLADHFDLEDREVRERQIRVWRKLMFMWSGFQRIYYSETAHDWKVFDKQNSGSSSDGAFYDKQVNVFRAYLESIIAALSVTVPSIECFPDDADNPLDLATAKAGNKISELVIKHNNVNLQWIHALFIYSTQGLIAAYNYSKTSDEFGSYNKKKFKEVEEEQEVHTCPRCGAKLPDDGSAERLSEASIDQFDPGKESVEADQFTAFGNILCPGCNGQVDPQITTEKVKVNRFVGVTKEPKTRQCIEVFGGLNVKVPNYARTQAEIPYLKYSYETHYSTVIEKFHKLSEDGKFGPSSITGDDSYEVIGRLSTQYLGEYPTNVATVDNWWFRPSAYNILPEENEKELRKLFPDGVRVVFVSDNFAEAENEKLDDHWTLTQNPLSNYLHYDPLGTLLTSIQEVTGDMISLVIQTIEHGIPQTFADPAVLNFAQYGQTEISPGSIFPAKPIPGKSIGDAFYEVKTSTLSPEVLPFMDKVQEAGQLVSGALPSLFGGSSPDGGKTAAQYSMSRAQALQRLQTPWKMLNLWWKDIMGKVIPAYIKTVIEDERVVNKDKNGNFVNVIIRKSELQGNIGSIELESSDELPVTWSQIKDTVMLLLQSTNPAVMAAITDPENIPILKRAIGLDDFLIPGQDDREKQYEEIFLLLQAAPYPGPDGNPIPTVDVEPLVDNHAIEADICRRWLVSDAGRLAKTENPDGRHNVLLHLQRHMSMMEVMAAPMDSQQQPGSGKQEDPGSQQKENPPPAKPVVASGNSGQPTG